jgi:hypothetical protein
MGRNRTTWQKGCAPTNPAGSPYLAALRASKNKLTFEKIAEYRKLLEEKKLTDPIFFLHEAMNDTSLSMQLRCQLAVQLALFCIIGKAMRHLKRFSAGSRSCIHIPDQPQLGKREKTSYILRTCGPLARSIAMPAMI